MRTKMIIERHFDGHRNLKMWVFAANPALFDDYSNVLINGLVNVSDFIPGNPLLIFPISQKQRTGMVFRDHYLLNPIHITDDAPLIFALTESVIESDIGLDLFFKGIENESQKLIDAERLQVLHDNKHLHIIGLFNSEPPLADDVELN